MFGKSGETLPQARDFFYDEDDDSATFPAPQLISSIRIITSKPPIFRQESQNSNSFPPSSLVAYQLQLQQHKYNEHQRKLSHEQLHPFHIQSMRHVLLRSTAPTSCSPPLYVDSNHNND